MKPPPGRRAKLMQWREDEGMTLGMSESRCGYIIHATFLGPWVPGE